MLTHAKAIVSQGLVVFSQSLFPFYSVTDRRLTIVLTVSVLFAGILVMRRLPKGGGDRALLGRALTLTGAGALVTAAGWAISSRRSARRSSRHCDGSFRACRPAPPYT
jgi:hypothetical protein